MTSLTKIAKRSREARDLAGFLQSPVNGQLTELQGAEGAVLRSYPKTTGIINDMTEILLALFVPRTHLINPFRRYATQRDTCVQVWTAVEPTLPFHIRAFKKHRLTAEVQGRLPS